MTPSRGYRGARVVVTGDTGFKGAWLSCWLERLGAEVYGIGLEPPTSPSMFDVLKLGSRIRHEQVDVRDRGAMAAYFAKVRPEFVFHLAAQPLVRRSFDAPLETLDTNVTGTANLLAALEPLSYADEDPCTVVVVTSDKCYDNPNGTPLDESSPLGGLDVYSASKGMTELLVAAWRHSIASRGVRIATARAGNVIGGGDWAADRIVPDAIRALTAGQPIGVRQPRAQRPWQHVLEALGGYLTLGSALGADGSHGTAFNFGPNPADDRTVGELCDAIVAAWGSGSWERTSDDTPRPEASALRLDIGRAERVLGWRPVWSFEETVAATVAWYREGEACGWDADRMHELTCSQIDSYRTPVLA